MESLSKKVWIKLSLINLLIVATIGLLMRYKIGFEFPHFDQKNLQYAHSHFAFCGWISQTLMVLIVFYLSPHIKESRVNFYQYIFISNIFCAYGMLISFAIQGYGAFSILFSSCSIVVSIIFAILCLNDFKNLPKENSSIQWFKASLLFNILSSIGTMALVWMMITKNIPQHSYLASMYWYLHFQYNGWFFFACIGLFIHYIKNIAPEINFSSSIFWSFACSCIPAYGLSTLWIDLPLWIYIIIVIAAFAQVLGWIKILQTLIKNKFLHNRAIQPLTKYLLIFISLALTIKLGLQLGSTIPSISKLAFGFRPIVIAYLHLVLLAIISVFLITYLYANQLLGMSKKTSIGLIIFVAGIFCNELALAVQGIASFSYMIVPYMNEALFVIACFILVGLVILVMKQLKTSD